MGFTVMLDDGWEVEDDDGAGLTLFKSDFDTMLVIRKFANDGNTSLAASTAYFTILYSTFESEAGASVECENITETQKMTSYSQTWHTLVRGCFNEDKGGIFMFMRGPVTRTAENIFVLMGLTVATVDSDLDFVEIGKQMGRMAASLRDTD